MAAMAGVSCNDEAAIRRETPPVPVLTAESVVRDLPERIRAIGAVESTASVTLRPQLSGQVESIVAQEGREVEAGDVLVRIDPRPFRAALREAEANRERLRALAKDSERNAALVREAMENGAATQRELDAAGARQEAAFAELDSAEAVVETATLNLSYCEIRAPFAGRLGAALVRSGAIVRANETPLMDLMRVSPIDVSFSVTERYLARVKAGMAASPLKALVTLPDSPESVEGALWFVDNRVDEATGQVRLKARFENEDARLWPGQFAKVELELGVDRDVVLVPARAVQRSQEGAYVFVLDGEQRAQMRPVAVRRTQDGTAVITEGLAGGETVITDGQLRVVPGARVAVRTRAETSPDAPGTSSCTLARPTP